MKVAINIQKIIKAHPLGVRLSVGCGEHKPEGDAWIGIDIRDRPGVDIVHDLEELPWPLPAECAQVITCVHVIEHIDPAKFGIIKFMDELWRLLKYEGQLMISTPYAGSPMARTDPGHVTQFTEASFYYFDPLHDSGFYNEYRPKPWKLHNVVFQTQGPIEILMSKRREDTKYIKNGKK
jgi:SAM-dependent methyltransferase